MEYAHIMPEDIFKNPEVKVYVEAGNSCLGALASRSTAAARQAMQQLRAEHSGSA